MKSSEILEFMTPHDGTQPEIPSAEQSEVAQRFNGIVENLQRDHASEVRSYSFSGEEVLLLELPMDNSVELKIEVKDNIHPREDDYLPPDVRVWREIGLQMYKDGKGREAAIFKFATDGIVRRTNKAGRSAIIEARQGLGMAYTSSSTIDEELSRMLDGDVVDTGPYDRASFVTDLVANRLLETLTGVNNQPVGLPEVNGLDDLITQPQVVPRVVL
jgi:hypothetical protein